MLVDKALSLSFILDFLFSVVSTSYNLKWKCRWTDKHTNKQTELQQFIVENYNFIKIVYNSSSIISLVK